MIDQEVAKILCLIISSVFCVVGFIIGYLMGRRK